MGLDRGRWLIVAATLCVATAGAKGQGDNGFLRGRGKFDAAFTYINERYDQIWVGDRKTKDPAVGEVSRETGSLWVAYGLRDDTDIVATASYVDAEADGTGNIPDERHLQDATLGMKWRFIEQRFGPGSFSLLATPAVKIPMSHYETNDFTAIGQGQIDYRFRGVAQYLFDCGVYVALESGFDYRTESTPNEVPVNLSVGATFWDRLTITPFYERADSLSGRDIGQAPFADVEEDYTRWGIAAYVRVTQTFGFTGGYKDTIDGKNTGELTGYWIGIVGRF